MEPPKIRCDSVRVKNPSSFRSLEIPFEAQKGSFGIPTVHGGLVKASDHHPVTEITKMGYTNLCSDCQ